MYTCWSGAGIRELCRGCLSPRVHPNTVAIGLLDCVARYDTVARRRDPTAEIDSVSGGYLPDAVGRADSAIDSVGYLDSGTAGVSLVGGRVHGVDCVAGDDDGLDGIVPCSPGNPF